MPGQKGDKLASRETSDFFPGLEVKNRDCPKKSGTDVPENPGRMVTLELSCLMQCVYIAICNRPYTVRLIAGQ